MWFSLSNTEDTVETIEIQTVTNYIILCFPCRIVELMENVNIMSILYMTALSDIIPLKQSMHPSYSFREW